MSNSDHRRVVDEIVRELDLVVYGLEQPTADDVQALRKNRERLRLDLEKLRDRLQDVADGWW